jgi:alpha-D-xyloside xylohydrolase
MSMHRRSALVATLAWACACSSSSSPPAEVPALDPACTRTDLDAPAAPKAHTPRWAFEPWISKDISTRDDTYAFVDGFRQRGIPVGAVVLDSPWETSYNTFVPNEKRYRDLPGMIADMHARDVKVVLWITQMVNQTNYDFEPGGDSYSGPSPNFEEGERCKYFVEEAQAFQWWKGRGAGVDFFNPHARAWWHRQQDGVLKAGVDGWKLDFGESYLRKPTLATHEGPKPHQEYSERYYEDFLAYGRSVRGPDFVTMVRAWDESYDIPGRFYAKKEHAPVAWMGDNRRDWVGLADALDHEMVSARAGYAVVGSDIGGYLDHDDKNLLSPEIPFDTINFARWTAVGALSPFMQLHGRANLTPWTVPDHADETVAVYKYWATLHHALVPTLYALAEEAHAGGAPVLRPVGEPSTWKGDYRYTLGEWLLVAPILDATGARDVALPAGARWFDWWTGDAAPGGATVRADFASDRLKIPFYVREGAIVPMNVDSDVLGLGDASAKGALTVLVYPGGAETSFRHREDDGAVTTLSQRTTAAAVTIGLGAVTKRTILRVRVDRAPATVTVGGTSVPVVYDAAKRVVTVAIDPRPGAAEVVVSTP